MHFLKMVNINSKNSDISEIDRQNAYKWFRFKFYKQASVLFEKIKDTEMTEM